MKSVCVFCGSTSGASPLFRESAERLGEMLGRLGIQLIYGGGKVGLMGIVADAVLSAGGRVTGVIPDFLHAREVYHEGIQELIIVKSMHERKWEMARRADAFIALPGGFGTFEEMFEAITWTQLNLQKKPVGILNSNGFYNGLLKFLDHAVDMGFIQPNGRAILAHADEPARLLDLLRTW